jgi:hypothetical protein
MPEQLSSFEQQREALAEKLKLREQYEQQIKTLNETGILEILPESQELGIIGIDGKGYQVPKYEEILNRITTEKLELLDKKFQQGFTKLLLVPFGMSLEVLIDRYERELVKHHKEGTLLSAVRRERQLDRVHPLYFSVVFKNGDISGEFVYEPKEFSQNHQGKTKAQLIQEKTSWQVILVEDLLNLSAKGHGQTFQGRHQFEANKSSEEYLRLLKQDSQYYGEKGFNVENWLTLAITILHAKNIMIDDFQQSNKKLANGSMLIGSCYSWYDNNMQSALRAGFGEVISGDNFYGLFINDSDLEVIDYSTRTRIDI